MFGFHLFKALFDWYAISKWSIYQVSYIQGVKIWDLWKNMKTSIESS